MNYRNTVLAMIAVLLIILSIKVTILPKDTHFTLRPKENIDVFTMSGEQFKLSGEISQITQLDVMYSDEKHYVATNRASRIYVRKEDTALAVKEPLSLKSLSDINNQELIHDFSKTKPQHIPYEYEVLNEELAKKYADRALLGDWYIPSDPYHLQVDDIDTFNWHEDIPESTRNSYPFQIHYLTTINYLTQAYNDTKDVRYLSYGLKVISSWVSAHPIKRYKDFRWAYNDHGTAIRTFHLINFWESYKDSNLHTDPNISVFMMKTIYEHGVLLSRPGFYKPHHNHGIFQDMALTAIAQSFPEFDLSSTWERIASNRLRIQFDQSFSEDALHLEHSPGYQAYMYHTLVRFIDWADSNKFTLPSRVYSVQSMPKQLVYMIKPNSTFPIFGDTSADVLDMDIIPNTEAFPELTYAVTEGTEGKEPLYLSKKIGTQYSFMREYWKNSNRPFSDAIQIMMTAGFHSNAHKHADDLSLDFYGFGRDFILETGRFGYTNRPERKQVFGVEAHNTVHRKGKDLNLNLNSIGKSRITTVMDLGAISIAIGESELIGEGAVHKRTLVYDKAQTLIVHDQVTSPNPDEYIQRFHLADGLEPTLEDLEGQNVVYTDNIGRSIQIMQLNRENTFMETDKSFVSARDYEWVQRNQVLSYTKGTHIHYLTLMRLDNEDNKIVETEVKYTSNEIIVRYTLSDQSQHEVYVPTRAEDLR